MNWLILLWQLPQWILAQILILAWKAEREVSYKGISVYRTHVQNGISLGTIIILSYRYGDRTVKHEYGHTRQSLMFGWLYLIIIGISSGGMNLLTRIGILSHKNYYKRWPESWADKLGEVEKRK